MTQDARAQINQLMEPWAVLATGAFITSCAGNNFSAIDLLRAPVQIRGTIDGRTARVAAPKWFPIEESFFESQAGLIYSRVKDLAAPHRAQSAGDVVQVGFDLSKVNLPPEIQAFTLTYFPWFRFLSEPISFDAVGRVAYHIANCLQFLLRSKGFAAVLQSSDDDCLVSTDGGVVLAITGMSTLSQLRIVSETSASSFDLAGRRIELAEDMFPAAYAAGRAMLETQDRLLNITAGIEQNRLILAYHEESHVQT